jgi:hypothetical protein
MVEISFKELARQHQVKFREEVLKVGYDEKETILKDEDAQNGLNFFDGFKINEFAQNRHPYFKLKQACFANMLRSEHIPFNFFVPLSKNMEYARAVLNRFLKGTINKITEIRIEYAPDPEKALMDQTSFDVFIEYKHVSGGLGILGVDVKYTEREYKLVRKSKEACNISDPDSLYNKLTRKIGIYKNENLQELTGDDFRQLWRIQLLGESMTRRNYPESKYDYFTSIILYPSGNDHLRKIIPKYITFFKPGYENSFAGITYEEFIDTAKEFTEEADFLKWLQYLEDRYIFDYLV